MKSTKYDVGYRKPPTHTRFVKGQSGNPRGRPKGSLNFATAVQKALKETVVVIENGRRKTITKLDAAVIGVVNRAVKGDAKAMQQLIGLAALMGLEDTKGVEVNAADATVMQHLMKRLKMHAGEGASDVG